MPLPFGDAIEPFHLGDDHRLEEAGEARSFCSIQSRSVYLCAARSAALGETVTLGCVSLSFRPSSSSSRLDAEWTECRGDSAARVVLVFLSATELGDIVIRASGELMA